MPFFYKKNIMKISIAITTYNRPDMTRQAFDTIHHNDRVGEIVIIDDCSTDENFQKLYHYCDDFNKVFIIRNTENIGMMRNKIKAIDHCFYKFALLADSDNIFDSSYIENIPNELSNDTIYMPDFALPDFDYSEFSNKTIDKYNINEFIDNDKFKCMLNTCNYIVPTNNFVNNFEPNEDVKETDTLWINYLWLKAGYKFKIVQNMRYFHRVHEGSGWLKNADYNMKMSEKIINLIKKL